MNLEEEKKKGPVWKKPQQKKKGGKKAGKGKQKPKQKLKTVETTSSTAAGSETKETEDKDWPSHQGKTRPNRRRAQDSGSESEAEDSGSEESGSEKGGSERGPASPASEGDEEQEDQEWARFQRGDDKQEYWWVYICDRKTHSLITPPYHLTNLVNNEEVELKFTAPGKPGHYNFTVCVRSDSYLGVDLMDDIRLDVQEAREAPTAHPQWEFEDESGDEEGKEASEESEYATDDDYEDDSD